MMGMNTSRRGLLAALAVAPLIAAPALAATPSTWARAHRAFLAAKDAEDRYDNLIARPEWQAAARGEAYNEAITDESDHLCDVRAAAEHRLATTPASDLTAVIWKIEHAREREDDIGECPDEWWEAIMADLHRLSGGLN